MGETKFIGTVTKQGDNERRIRVPKIEWDKFNPGDKVIVKKLNMGDL